MRPAWRASWRDGAALMQYMVVLLVLVLIVVFVTVPLRREGGRRDRQRRERAARAAQAVEDLEAAREAKYREIRDAELDRSTGKLSERDFHAVARALRAEAIEILRALDRARECAAEAGAGAGDGEPGVDATAVPGADGERSAAAERPGEQLPSGRR
jgi:uncharacterized membrane protein